jgi:hypothetical protein
LFGRLNLDFVLGNKLMFGTVNASKEHFEFAVSDFARAELSWPGSLEGLLTHRVAGLENYPQGRAGEQQLSRRFPGAR